MQRIDFPFNFGKPKDLTILEQVFCMVWLATNFTLQELRHRQTIIEQQWQSAVDNKCQDFVFENLEAMQYNTDAAVSYQSFPTLNTWIAYIRR